MHYTLCDLFSDLTQNAVEAGAARVGLRMEIGDSSVSLAIDDDGKGMSEAELERATDPFYTDGIKHPGRKIGLGIPFLIQTAESTGGTWRIESRTRGQPNGQAAARGSGPSAGDGSRGGPGTRVQCAFDLSNIDTPPVGDVAGFFRHVLTFDGRYEMTVEYREEKEGKAARQFSLARSELLEALGLADEGGFYDANALVLLGTFIESLMED